MRDNVSIELVERTPVSVVAWNRPGHEVIGFHSRHQIPAVDATSSSHQHVLGTLHDLLSHAKQVGLLKGFEAEVVIAWKKETQFDQAPLRRRFQEKGSKDSQLTHLIL